MADFEWNKDDFGENADKVNELINQAINFGKKSSEVKAKNVEGETKAELEELQKELNALKHEKELSSLLSDVPEANRKLVSNLIGNDPSKLEEVKKENPQLFEKNDGVIKLADLLGGKIDGQSFVKERTTEELKEAYKKGGELTPEEEDRLWKSI
jgi:hypothetical protein